MNDFPMKNSTGEDTASPVPSSFDLLNSLNNPACIVGLHGDVLYANGPFKRLFEDGSGDMGLDLSHPFFPEYRRRIALAYIRALKGSERQCFVVMRSSDGKRFPVEIYLFPLFEDNAVASILAFLRPVSDDRLASFDQPTAALLDQEGERRETSIMEFSPFPIIRIDRTGAVIDGSASLETFFGYSLEDFQRKRNTLFRSVSLYDFERIRKAMADIYAGTAAFKRLGEIKILVKDRQVRWVNAVLYPATTDREVWAVDVILEDISRIKELEHKLGLMNRIQIVGDLTKGILHSFNNLISVIVSRTQLLLQITEKDMVMEGLKVIDKTAGDIVKQIRRVEDFIGEGEGLKGYEVEDLIDVVEDAIEFAKLHFKVENKEKKRSVKIERRYFCLVDVKADIRILREIFISMIFKVSSGLKKEGTINILLKEDGAVTLTVMMKKGEEAGPERDDFFSSAVFSDIDIRRIAERLNIRIFEEESPNSFAIRAVLPASMVVMKGKKEPDTVEYRLRDHDIIIVEDEKTLQEILFELFDSMGNRVFVCDNGEDALLEFKKGGYDVIVTDYGIKGITGIELATRAKEIDERVVTVLLSGWMLSDLKSYKNVVDVFLPKPFKLDDLIKEISKTIQARVK